MGSTEAGDSRLPNEDCPWRLEEGTVDAAHEHMELLYGDINKQDPADFVLVAGVSAPRGHVFTVQFLIDASEETRPEMLSRARHEVNFYLVEKHSAIRGSTPSTIAVRHQTCIRGFIGAIGR